MSISVPGTVALIGAGEYLPPIVVVDTEKQKRRYLVGEQVPLPN